MRLNYGYTILTASIPADRRREHQCYVWWAKDFSDTRKFL